MNYEQKFIEIPFRANDSELKGWEYTIPEGMEAIVKDGKVIVKEKESEDEKIRKWLIRTLKALNTSGVSIDGAYEMLLPSIDWLEKQKEQKPAEWSEDIRDEFTRNIRNLITDKLTVHTKGLDGSEISSTVFIDDKTAKDIASGVLFYVGKEATKNPNREISEWSEEDKDKLEQCIRIISGWEGDYDIVKSPYSNFLKSLRPDSYKNCNSHWKPSEEQMGAIRTAIDVLRGQVYDGKELYPGTSHVLTMMLNYFQANNNDTKV